MGYIRRRLVRSTLCKEDFKRVYRLLDIPAIEGDCGALCGHRCCQEYEPGVGMYLLPGEELMFSGRERWLRWSYKSAKHHDFPESWKGLVAFVMCNGTCPREKRPVQCRTFPLMPYISPQGQLSMRLDTLTGSLICPLVSNPERHPLKEEFLERALEAWSILIRDPLIRDDVVQQSRKLDEDESAPWRGLFT
ncbi:MAG TPA: hypothetical protein GX512_00910 [Firmicutes bacterium]|nr:hypothetical protein [Candidatus Fermentithermobacillaceae bacterium]